MRITAGRGQQSRGIRLSVMAMTQRGRGQQSRGIRLSVMAMTQRGLSYRPATYPPPCAKHTWPNGHLPPQSQSPGRRHRPRTRGSNGPRVAATVGWLPPTQTATMSQWTTHRPAPPAKEILAATQLLVGVVSGPPPRLLCGQQLPLLGRQAKQGRQRPQAKQGQQRPQAKQGQQRPQAKQGQQRPQAKQGQQRPQAKQGQQRPQAKQGQQRPQAKQGQQRPQAKQGQQRPQAKQGPREATGGGEPVPAEVLGLALFRAAATQPFFPLLCSAAYARVAADHQNLFLVPPVVKAEAAPAPLPRVALMEDGRQLLLLSLGW
ncbi:UNVERIFIED_CONTAM: hypothetical protein FKN15_068316 [Acipenser sinensis]